MKTLSSLILSIVLIITCSGCIWEHDRGGYGDGERGRGEHGYQERGEHGDRDRGMHDGDRHDDRRDYDERR